MSFERLSKVILGPIYSEKSVRVGEKHNQSVIKVSKDSNKHLIAEALEYFFKVEVLDVRVPNPSR